MNKRAVRWLYGELEGLVESGVLPPDAADRLRSHYGPIQEESRVPVAMVIFSGLGAVLVGLGIILLLAHNWESLSRASRTVISFAPLLAGQAFVAYTLARRPSSGAWCEGSGAFLTLSIGTSIALIGQTYQIPGDFGAFLLTWVLLALPLAYLLNASLPAALYMAGVTGWTAYQQSEHGATFWFWPLAALIVPHVWQAYRRDAFGMRSTWLSWTGAACLCVGTGVALDRSLPGLWIIIYSSLFASLYMAGVLWSGSSPAFWRMPLRTVGGWGIVILALILSYSWAWEAIGWYHYHGGDPYATVGTAADVVLLCAFLGTASVLLGKVLLGPHKISAVLGAAPVVSVIGFTLGSAYEGSPLPALLYNGYLLCLGVGITVIGLQSDRLSTVNAGLAILSAWIVARFFDADMDFVTRGLVFILLGAGFFAANMVMLRRRRRSA